MQVEMIWGDLIMDFIDKWNFSPNLVLRLKNSSLNYNNINHVQLVILTSHSNSQS